MAGQNNNYQAQDSYQAQGIDPNYDLYKQQWLEMQARQAAQAQALKDAVKKMLEMLDVDAFFAMRLAEMEVMPEALGFMGDQIGVAGTAENVASSTREMVSNIQNLFNTGKDMNKATAEKLLTAINNFAETVFEENKTEDGPLGDKTPANLLNAVGLLAGAIMPPGVPPGRLDGATWPFTKPDGTFNRIPDGHAEAVATRISGWFNPTPGKVKPDGSTEIPGIPGFDPNINRVTTNLQSMSAAVGTVSTTQTAQEQYLNNTYNTLQATFSQMSQTENTVGNLLIANQKAN